MSQKIDVKIRAARADDMTQILELVKSAAHSYKVPAHRVTNTLEQLQKDGGFLSPNDPKFFEVLLVETEVDGKLKIVGYALYFYSYISREGKIGFLHDIYVDEPYRKQGIGTRLFNLVSKIFLENNCTSFKLNGKFSYTVCLLNTVVTAILE